ncbi:EamA-like transporter family protein [Microvirga sp. KLBC 81]|uniref:DMT family transporter n=1 Tax=Microvirga sp. KLBC 81 TaxID=1862707 RepID=UPI000D50E85D|nr:DMT family transporter [Microvirga sp. KLBC 81]PVE25620.1 EamA-like transporter family protein [Microvirga sp. KLBC 81]
MNISLLLPLAGILIGGVFLSSQAPINAALARALGDPLLAACISFGVGFLVLAILSAFRGVWPSGSALASAPWWAWLGGFLGAFYVAIVIWGVPQLGAVSTVAALILGQVVAALVLDAIGAFGLPVQAISWQRIVAAGLILGGLVLSRAG